MSGSRSHLLKALTLAAALCASCAHAQTHSSPRQTCGLGPVHRIEKLANGVRIHAAHGIEEILALRPDLLPVRMSSTAQLPEDASWAVVPEAHRSTAPVTIDNTANTITLHTSAVTADLSRTDLTLTIRDSTGRTLLHDAHVVCFTGHAFRVSETMPTDEHY